MKPRLQAIRALRLNYKWRGVWIWLKGRKRCRRCKGEGWVYSGPPFWVPDDCPTCHGELKRGYQRILKEPNQVAQEQQAIAEGVMG